MKKTLKDFVNSYQNTEEENDYLWELFKNKVDEIEFLKTHRDDIENRFAGFGDRSFHYMWYILLEDLSLQDKKINCLEIGVYKGQVVSLWALLKRKFNLNISITGITPLDGNYPNILIFRNYYLRKIISFFSPSMRQDFKDGNIHIKEDFLKHIKTTFSQSNLTINEMELIQGFSNEPRVIEKLKKRRFDLIYIDGDHSYEVAKQDFENYSKLLNKGGYIVMDDASYFLPGTQFFKGMESVSKVCNEIDHQVFKNILNIGHNRIYQKIA